MDIGITGPDRFLARAPNRILFQLRGVQNFEIDRVIQVVAVVGDFIRQIRHLGFERRAVVLFAIRPRPCENGLVLLQAFADFEGQVQTGKIRIPRLQQLNDPQALPVVIEASMFSHAFRKHFFARMPKRRMPKVVGESNCFRQILVEGQRPRDGAADRSDFDRMGQPCSQMVAGAIEENLRLVLQPAKCS